MRLKGKKIGILIESDFYDPESGITNFVFLKKGRSFTF